MDDKLLEQLALAKEAGTKAMAKDFFAPVPGGEAEASADGRQDPPPLEGAAPGGDSVSVDAQAEGLTPEQLEELLASLGNSQGGNT